MLARHCIIAAVGLLVTPLVSDAAQRTFVSTSGVNNPTR